MTDSALYQPTLILNRHNRALDATIAKEALCSVFSDKALIIDDDYMQYGIDDWFVLSSAASTDDPRVIITTSGPLLAPNVIRLTEYAKFPKREVVFSRRNLWRRDGYRCQFCGKKPDPDDATIDHLLPKSRGGKSTFPNCVLACTKCNRQKDNKTPEEAGMPLIRHTKNGIQTYKVPKIPIWSPIYALRRRDCPESWKVWLKGQDSDMYWEVELEE